jgi:hypothetical protein
MAFTLSCSGSGDDGGDNPPSGGITNGTGSFSGPGAGNKAQVYVDGGYYWDKQYTGNGDIKIRACDENWDYNWDNCDYIDAGKIEGGMVKLQLPSTVDSKYLNTIDEAVLREPYFYGLYGCNFPANVKLLLIRDFAIESLVPPSPGAYDLFLHVYSNEVDGWEADGEDGIASEKAWYLYSSGAANISCNSVQGLKDGSDTYNLNIAQGWNEIYQVRNCNAGGCDNKHSTDKSILKHQNDIKWSAGH